MLNMNFKLCDKAEELNDFLADNRNQSINIISDAVDVLIDSVDTIVDDIDIIVNIIFELVSIADNVDDEHFHVIGMMIEAVDSVVDIVVDAI